MNRQQILETIQTNANSLCSPSRPFLLSVDMDDRYSPAIYPDFKEQYGRFLKSVRHHFHVVHICHSAIKRGNETVNLGDIIPCENPEYFKSKFPAATPVKGEWLLGKPSFSAFQGTSLSQIIPKIAPVFVMGAYGQSDKLFQFQKYWCIDSTILGGLKAGFNMVAIPDMIYVRYVRRDYPEFGKIPTIHSGEILDALNIERQDL